MRGKNVPSEELDAEEDVHKGGVRCSTRLESHRQETDIVQWRVVGEEVVRDERPADAMSA